MSMSQCAEANGGRFRWASPTLKRWPRKPGNTSRPSLTNQLNDCLLTEGRTNQPPSCWGFKCHMTAVKTNTLSCSDQHFMENRSNLKWRTSGATHQAPTVGRQRHSIPDTCLSVCVCVCVVSQCVF